MSMLSHCMQLLSVVKHLIHSLTLNIKPLGQTLQDLSVLQDKSGKHDDPLSK